jgi:hypothetical protein
MANSKKYKADKDSKAIDVLAAIDDIIGEEHLPLDLQIQRVASIRDAAQKKVLELKAQL